MVRYNEQHIDSTRYGNSYDNNIPIKKIPLSRYRINVACHCRLRIAFPIVYRTKKSYRFGVALSLWQ